jgi:hypothetical protein
VINLLPDDAKRQIRAGRTNVILLNYIIITILAVLFLFGATAASYFVLNNTKTNAEVVIKDNRARSTTFVSVQKQAESFRTTLASTKKILDKEIVYTKLITSIAGAMPNGVIISTLALSPSILGAPTTLQAYGKTTADALKLKDNFQKSPLFSNVNFQIVSQGVSSAAAGYPIGISLSLTLNKSATQ